MDATVTATATHFVNVSNPTVTFPKTEKNEKSPVTRTASLIPSKISSAIAIGSMTFLCFPYARNLRIAKIIRPHPKTSARISNISVSTPSVRIKNQSSTAIKMNPIAASSNPSASIFTFFLSTAPIQNSFRITP